MNVTALSTVIVELAKLEEDSIEMHTLEAKGVYNKCRDDSEESSPAFILQCNR